MIDNGRDRVAVAIRFPSVFYVSIVAERSVRASAQRDRYVTSQVTFRAGALECEACASVSFERVAKCHIG